MSWKFDPSTRPGRRLYRTVSVFGIYQCETWVGQSQPPGKRMFHNLPTNIPNRRDPRRSEGPLLWF